MPRTGGTITRDRLLDEALRAFGRAGYAAVSLDDVAEAVGVRKQSLLYHFPSKDALLTAAAIRAAREIADTLESALGQAPDSIERIASIVREVHRLARRRPEVVALIREVARIGPPLSDRVARALRPLVDAASDWLQREMDAGRVRRQNPRLALLTIYSAVVGHLTESSVQRAVLRADDRKLAEAELVAFLKAALAP